MNSIKELRDRTGLSQSQFSKQFNIPLSTLRKWEQADATPAPYLVTLLTQIIPVNTDKCEKIICKDGSIFYFDQLAKTFIDCKGNRININENLDSVKRQNLPLYVKDMFDSFYEAQQKFISDCEYDKKEDFIWG